MHWRIGGRWRWGATFCGCIDNAKGHKGGERCCKRRIIIHKSVIESIASHKGVDNGRNTTKGDGDGVVWSKSE